MAFREIDRPPVTTEMHIWADYGELRCLDSVDRMVSLDDLYDVVHDLRDEREGIEDFNAGDPAEGGGPAQAAEPDVRRETWGSDVCRHWDFRAGAFGGWYPFIIKNRTLRVKPGALEPGQRLYLFLLFAGSGRYLHKPEHNQLTRAFEDLSLQALKRYLPPPTDAGLFHRGRYPGNLYTRIKALAADLGEACTARSRDFKAKDVGDGGLDIVALMRFGKPQDRGRGFLTVFVQCACSPEDWEQKQSSVDYNTWRNRINLQARPQPLVFIPFCYRQPDGAWYRHASIRGDTILVDRVRILGLLEGGEAAACLLLPAAADVPGGPQ